MKAHVPITSLHLQTLERQHSNLTEGDYEEWRNNPVTLRLFADLEVKTFQALTLLSETKPTDERLFTRHAEAWGYDQVTDFIFSWTPPGIGLDEEEGE